MAEAKADEALTEEQESVNEAKGEDSPGPTPFSNVPRVTTQVDEFDAIPASSDASKADELKAVRLQGPSSRGDDPPVHVLSSEEIVERGEKYAKTRPGAK